MNPDHYEVKKHFRIYAMFLDAEEQFFYVGKTSGRRLSAVYSMHRTGRIKATEGYFDREELPAMHLLEELTISCSDAYKHVVAWVHIFQNAGFTGINHDRTRFQADNLLPETKSIVENLCREDLNQLLRRTYLSNPAAADLPPKETSPVTVEQKEPKESVQINIRLKRHEKALLDTYCRTNGLTQRECFAMLLDQMAESKELSHMLSLLRDRDIKITKLKQENQTLKTRLDSWLVLGKSQRELMLEEILCHLREGICRYWQYQFPDTTEKSSLPEASYRKFTRDLPPEMKYQYPEEDGFLIMQLEAILWGKPMHRACFLVGTGEDGQRHKLRCYPRATHVGLYPRQSGYAVPGSKWFLGCQRSKDDAMELTMAFPLQQAEKTPDDILTLFPETTKRKASLSCIIRKAEEKMI